MIIAPTPCYFIVLVTGESAQSLMMEISPGAAADIEELTLLSEDFDSDIKALHLLDGTIKKVRDTLPEEVAVTETFNPLYVPASMEDVDAVLDLSVRSDGVRFSGFDGDPFTLKLVDLERDSEKVATFTARYHPFDLPLYTEIVEAHDNFQLN